MSTERAAQLGAPLINYEVDGRFALHRFHRLAASGNPITATNIKTIQQLTTRPMAPQVTREVFQQGGGDEALTIERVYRGGVDLQMKGGYVLTFLSQLLGITLDFSAGYAGIPMRFTKYPLAMLESIFRREDNEEHLFSLVFQDIMLDNFSLDNIPMDDTLVTVPFTTKHDFVILKAGSELQVETFTGDASTVAFNLAGTPVDITDSTADAREDWEFDDLVYVGVQESGDATHTRQRAGVTHTGGTVTFTTAPATGAKIIVPYVIDGDA